MKVIAILILIFTVSCAKSLKKETTPVKKLISDQSADKSNFKTESELQAQLRQAIVTSSTNLVRSALYRGANPNTLNIGLETALTYTIKNNQNSMFSILVNSGADTNLKNQYGESPIHLAVKENDSILAKILINDKDTDLNILNYTGETPFIRALRQKNKRLVFMLLTAKADLNIKSETDQYVDQIALNSFNKSFAIFILRLRKFSNKSEQEKILTEILNDNDDFTLRYIQRIYKGSSIKLSSEFVKGILYKEDKDTRSLMIETLFSISNISKYTQYLLLIESIKAKDHVSMEQIYKSIENRNPNFYDNMDRTLLSYATENGNYKAALFLRKKGAETYFETQEQVLINSCKFLKKRRLSRKTYKNFQNMLGC